MYRGLERMYESVIINEMTDRVVEYIDEHKDDILPFDNIFGDKLRVKVPLFSDNIVGNLVQDLETIKDFSGFDFDSESIVRDIPLDPKYGGGKKQQKVGIGKAIQALKIPEEKKKQYLNWYAQYKDQFQQAISGNRYSIVLSRAPIDIVRMSDHRNIHSCHAQDGSYFQCAVQEAISGGAVAYLVHKDSLDHLSEEEFQNKDLFTDNERKVRGVEPPLARLRIRRLVNDYNGTEMGFPELRTYGQTTQGFYNSVKNFLQAKQKLDPKETIASLQKSKHYLRGGSYEDNGMAELINRYFGNNGRDYDEDNDGYKSHLFDFSHHPDDEHDEGNIEFEASWEDEISGYKAAYSRTMDHGHIDYDYRHEEGGQEASTWGTQEYDLRGLPISDEFELDTYSDDFYGIERGKYGEEWTTFLEGLRNLFNSLRLDLDVLTFHASKENNTLTVTFQADNDSGMVYNAYDYASFGREMVDLDSKYDQVMKGLINVLVNSGFISKSSDPSNPYYRYNEYLDDEYYNDRYKYMSIDTDENELNIISEKLELFEPRPINSQLKDGQGTMTNYVHSRTWDRTVDLIIKNLYPLFNPTHSDSDQMELPLTESSKESIDSFTWNLKVDVNCVDGTVYFKMRYLTPNTLENISFEFADFLDDMWLHICNIFRLYLVMHWKDYYVGKTPINQLPPEEQMQLNVYWPKNYNQLVHTYGRYLP